MLVELYTADGQKHDTLDIGGQPVWPTLLIVRHPVDTPQRKWLDVYYVQISGNQYQRVPDECVYRTTRATFPSRS